MKGGSKAPSVRGMRLDEVGCVPDCFPLNFHLVVMRWVIERPAAPRSAPG